MLGFGAIFVLLLGNSFSGVLAETKQAFLDDLLQGYDKRIQPNMDTGKPIIVSIDMFINEFSSVNEKSMDYSIDMFLRQRWNDARLAYTNYSTAMTLGYGRVNDIWVPDLFFRNEKKASNHDVTVPNILLRLYPNGDIIYSRRVSLTLSCPMHLERYPLDTQVCPMKMESFGHTTKELQLNWTTKTPVEFNKAVQLPEFTVSEDIALKNCTIAYNTGSYSCIYIEFTLIRQYGFYITATYVPSILIVLLSFISFFVDVRATPARISLGLLTVLSITTMNSSIKTSMAKVSYAKAIDVWMAVCLAFVFLALLEFAVANLLVRREDREKKRRERDHVGMVDHAVSFKKQRNGSVANISLNSFKPLDASNGHAGSPSVADSDVVFAIETGETAAQEKKGCCHSMTSVDLEKLSRWTFPLAFLVFNIIYWLVYCL